MQTVSFIIPHKGREEFLIQTLKSIQLQNYNHDLINVLLVSQNKSLSKQILAFKKSINLKVFQRPEYETISKLRNYGAEHSESVYIAFLDADVYLSTNWLITMSNYLTKNSNTRLISAMQISSKHPSMMEKIRTQLSNVALDINVSFLPGRNLFLNRNTFIEAGKFPEHLITCEDYYFTDKVNRIGYLHYTSKANYIHLGEDKSFTELFHKEIWRGQSNYNSLQGRKVPISEIPSLILPPIILILFLLSLYYIFIQPNMLFATISSFMMILPIFAYSFRLKLKSNETLRFYYLLKFYLFYFVARIIGTLGGVFKKFSNTSHHE